MAAAQWSKFPYEQKPYTYAGPSLKKSWPRLHAGDLEPFHESGEGVYATLRGLMPDLPGDDLGHLAACVRERVVAPGDTLVREGEAGDALFIISRGRFDVRGLFGGREVSLGSLGRGDVVGEVGLLQHVPRTATVTALEPGLVMEIDGGKAGRLLDENPSMRGRLTAILDERVRKTLDLLKEKGTTSDGDPQS